MISTSSNSTNELCSAAKRRIFSTCRKRPFAGYKLVQHRQSDSIPQSTVRVTQENDYRLGWEVPVTENPVQHVLQRDNQLAYLKGYRSCRLRKWSSGASCPNTGSVAIVGCHSTKPTAVKSMIAALSLSPIATFFSPPSFYYHIIRSRFGYSSTGFQRSPNILRQA